MSIQSGLKEALLKAVSQKQQIALRSRDMSLLLMRSMIRRCWRAYLEKAQIGEPGPFFTQDGQTYYRIVVWNKPQAKEVMTLLEALEGDGLGHF